MCFVFGTVWSGFGGVSVWDCLEWVWGSECVGLFGVGLGE